MTASSLQKRISSFMKVALDPVATGKVAVAVSGGSDSMALALLMAHWGRQHRLEVVILNVDHGLRAESAGESRQVKVWMTDHGLKTIRLKWSGPHPDTALQKGARAARYRLMSDYCHDNDIRHLLLGHQLEDQAETALMRFGKGSGVDGLAAMQPVARMYGLELLRPLLQVPRAQLRRYLEQMGQDWIDDPSNENLNFARTRVGALIAQLEENDDGSVEGIALSAARMAKTSAFLRRLTNDLLGEAVTYHDYGFARLTKAGFMRADDEIAGRALSSVLRAVAGRPYGVKSAPLDRLLARMRSAPMKSASLGGCLVADKGDHWLICREEGRGLPEQPIGGETRLLWDNRFVVSDRRKGAKTVPEDLLIRRIGADGWRQIRANKPDLAANRLPAVVRNSLPAIWKGAILASAPLISYNNPETGIAEDRFEMLFRPSIDN